MEDTTKVMLCMCDNDFQDKTYGKNMRLFNWAENQEQYRCTVCERLKS